LSEDHRAELTALTAELREWLNFQARLGWLGTPRPEPPEAAPAPRPPRLTLEEVRAELGDCRRCRLAAGRTHLVFGEGHPRARLMFIGEGPGEEEDRQGRPFVGGRGAAPQQPPHQTGPAPGRGVHRQCGEMPPAPEPGPGAR
jgi:hypothetical protein